MATIPTPEQGKKILDFSAGTFDGSSNLIQSRNGATEHVSGDDVADYVNTSRIYNGLETESKTPVGAINEVNAKGVGDIKDVNLSSPADGDVLAYDSTSSKWVNRKKTGSDIAVSSSSSETIAEALSALFLINTYTASVTVGANGVTALKGQDMGYNSIPSGYTPIVYSFSCVNSNDLFFNLSSLTATGSQQFGVIRNISANAQNDKNCTIKITFIKSAFL